MAPCPHPHPQPLTLHCFSSFTLLLLSHCFALICSLSQAWLSHVPTLTPILSVILAPMLIVGCVGLHREETRQPQQTRARKGRMGTPP